MVCNRLVTPLTPHPVGRGPSLRAHYSASPLLRPPPTPDRAARTVMHSRPRRGARPRPVGPLRFLDLSVTTRHPSLPRGAKPQYMPMSSLRPVRASPFQWRLATPIGFFRGLRRGFTCVTARRFAPRVLRPNRLLDSIARAATCVIGSSHGELLSSHERSQAYPDAQWKKKKNWKVGLASASLFLMRRQRKAR
jgi:hypothetical protein